MRILFLTLNYAPELTGIGKFSAEMAEWLAARGHEMRVVTTPPYYPEWRVHEGYRAWRYAREMRAGVDVRRCPLWVPRRQSGARRVLNLLSFAVSSLPVLLASAVSFRPQIVAVVKPPMFVLPAVLAAARLSRAASWVHVQDFEIDVAFEMGLLKGAWLGRAMLRLENRLLRRFDLASTISERMRERLVSKGVAESRAVLFPNWVDDETIRPLPEPSLLRRALGIDPSAIVALYAGNMGEKQGVEILVEVGRAVADDPRIVLVLAGEGAARGRLERAAAGLGNVRFLPLQPVERLNGLLNLADVHLLPQRADAADLVMPSKLGGMLASGRPVVAGAHEATQVAREVDGAGIVVAPDDPEAMARALRTLAADSGMRARLGAVARERGVARWGKAAILEALERHLEALVGAGKPAATVPRDSRRDIG